MGVLFRTLLERVLHPPYLHSCMHLNPVVVDPLGLSAQLLLTLGASPPTSSQQPGLFLVQ